MRRVAHRTESTAGRTEPIFGAPDPTMTCGERAALEGLLALTRPGLAIVIGTPPGNSLCRIAAYSAEVHVFAPLAAPPHLVEMTHVQFHAGAGPGLLDDALRRFGNDGRNVDFVMLHEDHAPEEVQKVVVSLLESAATADTVIVLHNTMNEYVRAGIARAGVEGYPKVAAFELDAVSGYLVKEGELRGGLGIIKTDARRAADSQPPAGPSHAFPAHPALDLQNQLRALQIERDRLAGRLANVEQIHALFSDSRSWKLTRPLRDVAAALRRRRFVQGLRHLNDTLAGTELAGRYWVWGGLLIGWAREGKPLAHDSCDADFCILADDMARFARAVPVLVKAGFAPSLRYFANDGRALEYVFERDGVNFEFFVMESVDGLLRYHTFGTDPPIQAIALIPDQPLVPLEFVGRTWHKQADHAAELAAIYGDWRTPDPSWWYMESPAVVERSTWTRADDTQWAGDVDAWIPTPGSDRCGR